MSRHGIIRRYTLEIEKIESGQYPSFAEIRDYLFDHGFEISERTLQRDIEHIRFEFGIEIKYDNFKNGYIIDYENSVDISSFFRFLEIVNTAHLLTETLAESKENLKYISFDQGGGLKGIQNLPDLLQAIKDHRKIEFTHFNFTTGKQRAYKMRPYLLREYQNRWYVIGTISDSKQLLTFGVDRIEELKVTTELFKPDKSIDAKANFDQIIGVIYAAEKAEEIILSFTPLQGMYIKSLPLHPSQKIILDNENEVRASLFLRPNLELMQQILMRGEQVKVLEPQWLRDEIKNILATTLKKY